MTEVNRLDTHSPTHAYRAIYFFPASCSTTPTLSDSLLICTATGRSAPTRRPSSGTSFSTGASGSKRGSNQHSVAVNRFISKIARDCNTLLQSLAATTYLSKGYARYKVLVRPATHVAAARCSRRAAYPQRRNPSRPASSGRPW